MSLKAELLAAIAAERTQYLAKIDEVLASRVSEADKAEILAAIRAIVPDEAPAEGLHNVSISAISEGAETMSVVLENKGADDEQAGRLSDLFDGAVAAANAQPDGGEAFTSRVTFSDNVAIRSAEFSSEAKKAAFDLAIGQAVVAIATAQLGNI